jgi:Centromere DNA-binding protein complex CBF3 subunit, domain 2
LHSTQVALGTNNYTSPRGPLTKAYLNTMEKKETRRKREEYHDRGKNTLNDGYTREELLALIRYFFQRNSPLACRDKLCFLMSHAMLLRSETALGTQFPDLFSMELDDQGVSPCIALVATITFGKTNQNGKIQYGSALRHINVELCPVGALALHFFSRFHFENEAFPDFTERKNWYDTYLFPKKGTNQSIKYDEQAKIYREAFKKVGIHSSKVTHINRKSAINMITHHGVPGDQQRQVGRWGTDRMVGCYIAGLPVDAIKVLAGFTAGKRDYFLSRSTVMPPKELQLKVFPQIEHWEKMFHAKEVQEDIAGPNFLGLLKYLRVVLLQVMETVNFNRRNFQKYI